MPHLPVDNDNRSRPCRVRLYRRPLVGPLAYHWALYFDWGDYDAYYEADDGDGGKLTPHWSRGKPPNSPGVLWMDVGRITVSPRVVNERARNNPHNGKEYILTMMNCQVWAHQLANSLGLNIPIPANLVQVITPTLGMAANVLQKMGLFNKK
ncbi:hypothetical protein SK128_005160 [Halocaridina rubra]|uniref:Uncharacterized protein n=1 Tax=Halocaridina rubra TaxID=373956 RepID=A0AAN8XFE4_HALRR